MSKKPNVVLICVDHWPGKLIYSSGKKDILTPTLDRMAISGITFDSAYSTTPTCIPARRALMTGTSARTHGDRVFNQKLRMNPDLPTIPMLFKKEGYQTFAVGKLHVFPQRDRIGFDEAIIHEEGRHHLGMDKDDYEQFLTDYGHTGEEMTHGMGVNDYPTRPWHLDEKFHPTYWTTKQICRTIQRRNKDLPGLWYVSYATPHPPITPLRDYMKMYDEIEIDERVFGEWTKDKLPYALEQFKDKKYPPTGPNAVENTIKAFHAQCTYIDHQIKLIIGTLREEGILDETIIIFTGDHGDMLGNHGMWAKPTMFEPVVNIPMIVIPNKKNYMKLGFNKTNSNLVALRDVLPTLLELCDIDIPEHIEGISMFAKKPRTHITVEHWEDERAMRMVRNEQFKLIYYPYGNHFQLFDLENDPQELHNLYSDKRYSDTLQKLKTLLLNSFYGSDLQYIKDNQFVGIAIEDFQPSPHKDMAAQRGWRK